VFIVVYFVTDSIRKLLDTSLYEPLEIFLEMGPLFSEGMCLLVPLDRTSPNMVVKRKVPAPTGNMTTSHPTNSLATML
jgi:hypothetical protein